MVDITDTYETLYIIQVKCHGIFYMAQKKATQLSSSLAFSEELITSFELAGYIEQFLKV